MTYSHRDNPFIFIWFPLFSLSKWNCCFNNSYSCSRRNAKFTRRSIISRNGRKCIFSELIGKIHVEISRAVGIRTSAFRRINRKNTRRDFVRALSGSESARSFRENRLPEATFPPSVMHTHGSIILWSTFDRPGKRDWIVREPLSVAMFSFPVRIS